MTDPDKLPALPMRTLREEIAYQQAKGFYRNSIDLQTLLAWLGAETAAIATERARADALQAELDAEKETTANLVRALREEIEGPTFMGEPVLPPIYARADALEAALQRLVVSWDKLPAHRYSLPTNVADWLQINMQPGINAARALLEKK